MVGGDFIFYLLWITFLEGAGNRKMPLLNLWGQPPDITPLL